MGASYEQGPAPSPVARIYEALYRDGPTHLPYSIPDDRVVESALATKVPFDEHALPWRQQAKEFALQLVQDRADIDISGREFNLVRSIRVFDVRYARQHESGRDGDCNRSAIVSLGTYGTQGEFSWRRSSPGALPSAHIGLERWGDHCPSIWHRSVFVEWRDYEGNYGFEQVNY